MTAMTANDIRAALASGTMTREAAIDLLRARDAAAKAAGRMLRFPSAKLLAELLGHKGDTTRRAMAATTGSFVRPPKAEAKVVAVDAPAKAQPAKPAKAKAKAKPAKVTTSANVGGLDLSGVDPKLLAAFLQLVKTQAK